MGHLLGDSRTYSISYELIQEWPEQSVQSSWVKPSVTARYKEGAKSFDRNVKMQSPEAVFQSPVYRDNIEALSNIDLSNATLLDFGCANGAYRSILATHPVTKNWKYVGADVNAELVEFCRVNYPNNRFELIDKDNALPFKDDEFDVIFASGVVQYIKDYVTIISGLRRITKDYFVISRLPLWKYNKTQVVLQHVYHEWGEEHHPIHVFNRNGIEVALAHLGFSILWHDYGSEFFYVPGVAEPAVHNAYLLRKNRTKC